MTFRVTSRTRNRIEVGDFVVVTCRCGVQGCMWKTIGKRAQVTEVWKHDQDLRVRVRSCVDSISHETFDAAEVQVIW